MQQVTWRTRDDVRTGLQENSGSAAFWGTRGTEVKEMKKALQWSRDERIVRWSVFAGIFALAGLTLWVSVRDESGPPVVNAGSNLTLPLKRLKANKLFLFRYQIDPSTTTPVAVQKGSDGTIRAALASCRACARSQNYEWSGRLICGHCRHSMKMPDLGTRPDDKKPGCVLASLAYSTVGDQLVVQGETIVAEYSRQFKRENPGEGSR